MQNPDAPTLGEKSGLAPLGGVLRRAPGQDPRRGVGRRDPRHGAASRCRSRAIRPARPRSGREPPPRQGRVAPGRAQRGRAAQGMVRQRPYHPPGQSRSHADAGRSPRARRTAERLRATRAARKTAGEQPRDRPRPSARQEPPTGTRRGAVTTAEEAAGWTNAVAAVIHRGGRLLSEPLSSGRHARCRFEPLGALCTRCLQMLWQRKKSPSCVQCCMHVP